ncbi:MAG: ribosome maturation factor RimM [Bacteroidota bacterium]|jgi:16S rRNA processing protein RimM
MKKLEHHFPEHYQIGTIHRTHGVRGDMIMSLDTDTPSRYKTLKLIYLNLDGTLKEYDVTKITVREKEKSAVIHLNGIEDMTTAENYLKLDLYLPLSTLPKLSGKKFYYHEIIGMKVIDEKHGELGIIDNVYELPQHPVAEFTMKDKTVMFPLLDIFIDKISRSEMIFYTKLPEGLLETYLEE